MTAILKAACVQMTSGPDIAANLKQAEGFIREAAAEGARLIATPENTCHIRVPHTEKLKSACAEKEHPALPFFENLAKELNVWLLLGSLSIKLENGKIANRSYLFNDQGEIKAKYDKIHLFDADLPTGERHHESATVQPGTEAVVGQTPWGGVGMSICYDLRFAYLYRALAQAGAQIITVPAAFTVPTGQVHWEILLRARAIETGSFILAPAQTGEHEGGRKTYGHSMIVGPWGEVLGALGTQPGIITADLDMNAVHRARQALAALDHDRDFKISR